MRKAKATDLCLPLEQNTATVHRGFTDRKPMQQRPESRVLPDTVDSQLMNARVLSEGSIAVRVNEDSAVKLFITASASVAGQVHAKDPDLALMVRKPQTLARRTRIRSRVKSCTCSTGARSQNEHAGFQHSCSTHLFKGCGPQGCAQGWGQGCAQGWSQDGLLSLASLSAVRASPRWRGRLWHSC